MSETTMRLSEAIRQGARLRLRGEDGYFTVNENGELCSCALGAAYEAIHPAMLKDISETLRKQWPWMFSTRYMVRMPVGEGIRLNIFDCIVRLNDLFDWTREQIADWVEQKERELMVYGWSAN